jgi:hypothetical protein
VSFATITLRVASQRVFIDLVVYFVMTQSGNFWIHPRIGASYFTPEGNEQYHTKTQTRDSVSEPRFEPGIFGIRSRISYIRQQR